MIIVKLIGGLGNQLFQYAAGRRLASIHNAELKLDVSGFKTYKLHAYSLNHFHITALEASDVEIEALKDPEPRSLVGKITERFKQYGLASRNPHYIKEPKSGLDTTILNLPDNVHLDGYWQSEKYFKDIEAVIRREYTLRYPLTEKSQEVAKKIKKIESAVAIHVRRADYINSSNQQIYETLGSCYYKKALEIITEKISSPSFFIFSDDIIWARENFKLNFPTTFMDFNGVGRNYEDLHLMSLCKHQIIANSSFSWWGAWLNENKNKTVIAPEFWLRGVEAIEEERYPTNWITI